MDTRRNFLKKSMYAAGLAAGLFTAHKNGIVKESYADSAKPNIPTVTLNNGVLMPQLGFGTLGLKEPKTSQKVVEDAIECGYRLFDTAQSYLNEEIVGAAFKSAGIKRNEFFITVKIFEQNIGDGKTEKSYDESLKKLNIDYADLVLIHQPVGDVYGAYRDMVKLYKEKRVRAIGLSNFYPSRFIDMYMSFDIKPAVNQIECHPYYQQIKTQKFLQDLNVQMEAFSPLYQARDNILSNNVLVEIGKKHNKTAAQVILRWIMQRGIVTIPKTTKKSHMIENINIFDFTLDNNDLAKIAALDNPDKQLLNHLDPDLIRWFHEREPGTSLAR